MIVSQPMWGQKSRFFLPNEDAHAVREAIAMLGAAPRFPVFVGGSGLLILEVARTLPGKTGAVYVDISLFQVEYFGKILTALGRLHSPEELREWFSLEVYPVLRDHFVEARDRLYLEEQVYYAMEHLFRIRFFFEDDAFTQARDAGKRVKVSQEDIVDYLGRTRNRHDFVYLSNILDYLPTEKVSILAGYCMSLGAAVYALVTEACPDQRSVAGLWKDAGFEVHPGSDELSAINRGLGSKSLDRPWNRVGEVLLLTPGK